MKNLAELSQVVYNARAELVNRRANLSEENIREIDGLYMETIEYLAMAHTTINVIAKLQK